MYFSGKACSSLQSKIITNEVMCIKIMPSQIWYFLKQFYKKTFPLIMLAISILALHYTMKFPKMYIFGLF